MSLAARIRRLEQRINRLQSKRFFLVAVRTEKERQCRIQAARAAGHIVQGDIVVALPGCVQAASPAPRWIGDGDRLAVPEDEALEAVTDCSEVCGPAEE